jgi:hypothetical protein
MVRAGIDLATTQSGGESSSNVPPQKEQAIDISFFRAMSRNYFSVTNLFFFLDYSLHHLCLNPR